MIPNYYTVTTDFGGTDPNIGQLDAEIKTYISNNPGNITPIFQGMTSHISFDINEPPYATPGERIVTIYFDTILTTNEKLLLDQIISDHVPVFPIITNNFIKITPSVDFITDSTYRRINKPFIFPGITYATASSISYMDSSVTSYDIQIYDQTNDQILLTTNLTNTTESVQNLGILTNLSLEPFVIEIFAKRNGANKKVYLESININYN